MTAKEMSSLFISDAMSQGYSYEIALEMSKFATDKILNHAELNWMLRSYWLDVYDELESQ